MVVVLVILYHFREIQINGGLGVCNTIFVDRYWKIVEACVEVMMLRETLVR